LLSVYELHIKNVRVMENAHQTLSMMIGLCACVLVCVLRMLYMDTYAAYVVHTYIAVRAVALTLNPHTKQ
jgi:hypothetical protein